MNAKSEKDRDSLLSDIDILKTTEYLNQFKKNLDWDSGFMLR